MGSNLAPVSLSIRRHSTTLTKLSTFLDLFTFLHCVKWLIKELSIYLSVFVQTRDHVVKLWRNWRTSFLIRIQKSSVGETGNLPECFAECHPVVGRMSFVILLDLWRQNFNIFASTGVPMTSWWKWWTTVSD